MLVMAHASGSVTAQLLDRVRAGDRSALDALVARFEVPLRSFLRRRLSPDALADGTVEDLFQETQLEAFRSLPSFTYQHDGSYLAWLYTIARRCLAREYERSKKRPRPVALDAPGTTTEQLMGQLRPADPSPHTRIEQAEQLEIIAQALAELPDARREAIVLCYFEGRDGAEAAGAMGLSPDAFRACLSRARRQLATVLDRLLGGGESS